MAIHSLCGLLTRLSSLMHELAWCIITRQHTTSLWRGVQLKLSKEIPSSIAVIKPIKSQKWWKQFCNLWCRCHVNIIKMSTTGDRIYCNSSHFPVIGPFPHMGGKLAFLKNIDLKQKWVALMKLPLPIEMTYNDTFTPVVITTNRATERCLGISIGCFTSWDKGEINSFL